MAAPAPESLPAYVALLAEGVGRNFEGRGITGKSLVALLAEGVGRNLHKTLLLWC